MPAGVDDEEHRPASRGRQVGGRAVRAVAGDGRAVEQAHDTLRHDQRGPVAGAADQGLDGLPPHGPGVEVEAGPPTRRAVKRAVDIVRADLGRSGGDAGAPEMAEQSQGDEGLAAA